MENWLLFLIIILSSVWLLFFRFNLKSKITYNLIKNEGKLKIYVLRKIPVINVNFRFVGKKLELDNKKGKTRLISLKTSGEKIDFVDTMLQQVVKKLKVKKTYVFINIGAEDNAFLTAMLTGYIKIIFSIFLSKLTFSKKHIKITNNVYPKYEEEVVEVTVRALVAINLFGLINSIITTLIKIFKQKKEKRVYE